MKDSAIHSPGADNVSAAGSERNDGVRETDCTNESSIKRSSSEFVVDLTDSPVSKKQTVETKEEPPNKKAPTIGNDHKPTFIPPIRIGGTSLLPAARLSVGSAVSNSDSPVAQAEEPKIKLSTSQKRAVDAIMARKSVFFSGAAGSGKSFLLKVVQDVLDSIDKGDRIAFTAPTGVAACNIRGMTIHAWAGIGLGKDPLDRIVGPIMRNREVRSRWTETDILVIDEISMLSGETFDLLSEVGKRVRSDPRPFGGLQLVMCGDFFQLPPVGLGKTCSFCFQSETWKALFYNGNSSESPAEMIFLHKGFRQNDNVFLRVLNELRRGVVSSKTDQLLTQKVNEFQRDRYEKIKQLNEARLAASALSTTASATSTSITPLHNKPKKKEVSKEVVATKLYSTNKHVDEYNDSELRKLTTKSYIFNSFDEGSDQFIKQLRAGMKAVETLELKVGAQVLLLKNLDTSRGLVNGAKGVVTGFEMQFVGPPVHAVTIGDSFKQSTSTMKAVADPCLPIVQFEISRGNGVKTTEVVTLKREKWELAVRDRVMASRIQIPLMLAWAISIHKAQGMTIPDLEVSFQGIFEVGQAYVALSRATSLEGLHLQSFERNAVRAHELVKDFYSRRMGAGDDIDPRDEPCVESSVSELAATFQDPDGAFGSSKRNDANSKRDTGEWVKPKDLYNNEETDAASDIESTTLSSLTSGTGGYLAFLKRAKSRGAWDDWKGIYELDDWEDLRFVKSAPKQANSHSHSDSDKRPAVDSSRAEHRSDTAPREPTEKPKPTLSLASMLNRDESGPVASSSSTTASGGHTEKYRHSQQQDIKDTWMLERSANSSSMSASASAWPRPPTHQPMHQQPARPVYQQTPQQQSNFATMKSNLFVPPSVIANDMHTSSTTAPSSTTKLPPLTDEQKRRIEENRQAALRKQAALRLQQQGEQ